MKVVVEDANVLLDLVNGEVLAVRLGCGYEHCTTHLVWNEVSETSQRSAAQPFVDSGVIALADLPATAWSEVVEFSTTAGVSISDASVWWLAKTEKAILLTGDSKLRKGARDDGVEVRGMLWVVDELVNLKRVAVSAAAAALEKMIAQGAFLPASECEQRIKKWRRTS